MKRRNKKPIIHKNANKKLVRVLRAVKRETGIWNQREVARRLKVNPKYVNENLLSGIEPTDATTNGREVRLKLFMREYVKREKTRVQCPRCGQLVFATKSGRPRAHYSYGEPCESIPKPLWKKRWLDIPKSQRDAWLEDVMTNGFQHVKRWLEESKVRA